MIFVASSYLGVKYHSCILLVWQVLQEGAGHAQDEPVPGGDEAGGGGQEEPAPHLLRHHRGRQRYDQRD
jgi:hypothetical protein